MLKAHEAVLIEVVKGEYIGLKFVLTSVNEIKRYFNYIKVKKCVDKDNKTHRKCTFKRIPLKDLEDYATLIPGKVINDLCCHFKPILGTVVEGKHKGYRFVLTSTKEVDKYFYSSNVYEVMSGKLKTCKKCVFKRIPLEEAKNYPKPKKELLDDLNNHFTSVLGKIIEGEHRGLTFIIRNLKEVKRYFNDSNFYGVLIGRCYTHRGCTFRRISVEEAKNHSLITAEIHHILVSLKDKHSHKRGVQ